MKLTKLLIFILSLFASSNNFAQVGIGTNTPNISAALDVSSTTKGFLPPRMTTAQKNAILTPVDGLLVYQTDSIAGLYLYMAGGWLNIHTAPISKHFIGESYGGGIVFFVYDNGQHGLIAATTDQSTGISWSALASDGVGNSSAINMVTKAQADGIGAGSKNTSIEISSQVAYATASFHGFPSVQPFAATVCNEYSVTINGVTYGDWYLPSVYELNLLYLQQAVVGNFGFGSYWSSTENDDGNGFSINAWSQEFSSGFQFQNPKSIASKVRAVRAF